MHLHSAAHALSRPSRCFKFDAVLLHSNLGRLRRNYLSEIPADINVLSCGPNSGIKNFGNFGNFGRHLPRATSTKIYVRLPHAMAQFGLKIEKLSHIIGTAPTLEMARADGLRLRLWPLLYHSVKGS